MKILQFKNHFNGWSSSWSSSFSSSTFQTGTFLRQPTRPKLDSAACAPTLNHLCISHTPQSEMDGNVFSIFSRIYFSSFSIVFLTGLQSYISTIVFSRRLYHSGVELPIVSSSKLGRISLSVFRRKRIDFVKTAAFAFGLPSVSGPALSPTVRLLYRQTTVCLLVCLFLQIAFVDQILRCQSLAPLR